MKPHAKKCTAVAFILTYAIASPAMAQAPAKPNTASMVIVPGTSSASGPRASNPDNMPVKRPTSPADGDRMILNSPASDAIAK